MKGRRLFARARGGRPGFKLGAAGALLAALWLGGFVSFIASLPGPSAQPMAEADAIVALTGGKDRLIAAMALLSAHKGKRLLISGVNQETPRADVKSLLHDPGDRFDCCVDMDRVARNTAGNADETARWARGHGFRSLIVVTAHYHMPRSLLELGRALPNCRLLPYPVVPGDLKGKPWWHPGLLRLLVAEYTKYLLSGLRIAFEETFGGRPSGAAEELAAC